MDKAYSRINWINKPSTRTPINDVNLNREDLALDTIDDRVIELYNTKAEKSTVLTTIQSVTYNPTTGLWTFTHVDGTTQQFDQNIEKIPVSFSMDSNGIITMTTSDGTQYTADVGSLIKTYTFTDSTEIDFTATPDASGNKTVTASIKAGSITGEKLQPNYLADVQAAVTQTAANANAAALSAQNAQADATLAESYLHGNTGTRTGEDTDNTQYYYLLSMSYANGLSGIRTGEADDNAKEYARQAKASADSAASIVGIGIATTTTPGLVKPDGTSVKILADGTISTNPGHTIYDSTGTALAQKEKLKFASCTVVNVNDTTVVTPDVGGVSAEDLIPVYSTSAIPIVNSFNGRYDAVMPQQGDYTAAMVGAVPMPTGNVGQLLAFTEEGVIGAIDGVTSFKGRTGPIVPQNNDYTAAMVGALPTQTGTAGQLLGFTAQDTVGALNATGLYTGTSGQLLGFTSDNVIGAVNAPATGVTKFNNRTGDVTPANGDYSISQISATGTIGQVIGFTARNTLGAMNVPAPSYTGTKGQVLGFTANNVVNAMNLPNQITYTGNTLYITNASYIPASATLHVLPAINVPYIGHLYVIGIEIDLVNAPTSPFPLRFGIEISDAYGNVYASKTVICQRASSSALRAYVNVDLTVKIPTNAGSWSRTSLGIFIENDSGQSYEISKINGTDPYLFYTVLDLGEVS